MAQDRYQNTQNGQELQQADINLVAKEASLADDRVFAELLRLAPYNGTNYAKAILPYAAAGVSGNAPTVGASTGGVVLNPFRAIVGSRTAAGTLATDNWNDIRSQFYTGSSTALQGTQSLAANSSGNPRWDLVYVAFSADANGASNTRYLKNPATKVVSATSITTTLTQGLAIGVVQGTPAASPVPSSTTLPADTGVTIYIPLAFVRVINGFTAATVLNNRDIYEIAPVVSLSRSAGVASLRPADQQYLQGGTAISGTGTSAVTPSGPFAWNATTNTRPVAYIPPSMQGMESIIIAIDLSGASSANWSHQSGAIVDASRDWRNRLFKWTAWCAGSASTAFPWVGVNGGGTALGQGAAAPGVVLAGSTPMFQIGGGESFTGNTTIATLQSSGAASAQTPAVGFNMPTNCLPTSSGILLSVDGSGRIVLQSIFGTPAATFLIWLDATGPFTNA